jgi:uncharacterized protein YdhG (YjbR/CyaY superfamily)
MARQVDGFSEVERQAIKERARETRAKSAKQPKLSGEQELMAKIAEMAPADAALAKGIHELVLRHAPELSPKTWYGMPAYAKNGKVVVFFQAASKFKTRYATLGFSEDSALDEGDLWPTSFGVGKLTAPVRAEIIALLQKAVGASG